MTIGTIEDLEALPVDSEVEIQRLGKWVRAANGLTSPDGTTLGLRHFTGAVSEGLVTAVEPVPPVTAGTVFHHGGYRDRMTYVWVVVRVADDEWTVASLRRHEFIALRTWSTTYAHNRGYIRTAEADKPVYTGLVVGMSLALLEAREARATREAQEAPEPRALHQMRVILHGSLRPDVVRAALGMPEGDTVVASFSRTVRLTREGLGCICGTVTREEVASHVPTAAEDDWAFNVSH